MPTDHIAQLTGGSVKLKAYGVHWAAATIWPSNGHLLTGIKHGCSMQWAELHVAAMAIRAPLHHTLQHSHWVLGQCIAI